MGNTFFFFFWPQVDENGEAQKGYETIKAMGTLATSTQVVITASRSLFVGWGEVTVLTPLPHTS